MTQGNKIGELFDLTGRVAIVTGSTRGIGLAIARTLAEAGASVVISSEDGAACASTAAEFVSRGHRVIGHRCDVASEEEIKGLTQAAVSQFGGVDVLVCNAGIPGPVGPAAQASLHDVDRVLNINLRSAMMLTTEVIPQMVARGGGSVIFIASIAGLRGNRSIGLYGVSKAALAQLARNLAVEWGPQGIRVNAISPGLIATEFSRELMANKTFMERRLAMTPLRRAGAPEEIASTALFLATAAGGFITGQNIVVDGGTLISDGS
jgi:NAD(P)-dependent dehydrogenase (short-subunit alcohol dehydrogenase family)